MKCPHCLVEYHDKVSTIYLGQDVDGDWGILKQECPSCKRLVLQLVNGNWLKGTSYSPYLHAVKSAQLVRPKVASRSPVPREVPIDFAKDYSEACNVLTDSPKASTALSRRCLQHILREKAGAKKGDLADEIQQVIDSKQLSSYLIDSLDAIRNIGNFAAHPMKSNSTGAIVDVEQGEADWNLDVIEALFDAYFVQPAVLIKKREDLNKKLQDAGKPPMK